MKPSCRSGKSTNGVIERTNSLCERARAGNIPWVRGADRQRVIVERLKSAAQVTVAELAMVTGASEMTVRRDLDVLAAHGVLRRVHGGAVPATPSGVEPPFAARAVSAMPAKK